jgi:ATP-dependent exoDNAse (exonuclease V) beta subunit
MQLRVLQALRGAQQGADPDAPHLRLTAEFARQVLERDRDLGWQIVDNPRRMRIQTLDSLNASIARSQPLSSAGGASANAIVVDAELKNLYRQAAAATLDWLTEAGAMHDATEQVLLHVDTNTWAYVAYLSRMLETRDQWLPFVGSGIVTRDDALALRRRFEQSLENVVARQLSATLGAFPDEYSEWFRPLAVYAAGELIAAGKADHPVCAIAHLEDLPGAEPEAALQWMAVAELLLTQKGDWRRTVNKNLGFPPGDDGQKQAFVDLLEALRDHDAFRIALHRVRSLPPVRYSDEQWSVLLALFRLLPLAVSELKRLFNEKSLTDHIEVALTASTALGTADSPGDVALLLDYQVRHILVDEMQDTSSAQYRMLEALTGGWEQGDGRTLFCVGDPMQSIYRFRNAEVGQFLLARENGIGSVVLDSLVLRRNFRSGEHLVEWFNTVFPSVLASHDDPAESAVSYSSAVPVPAHEGIGDLRCWPVFGSGVGAEADRGLEIVRETLAKNPDDDMAVLVRSRTQLPALLSRLRQSGIPYRAVDIDRLTDLPEVIELLALTRACAHPGDRLAWLALLRAPWIGLDWTDLHMLVRNDTASTVWELLNDAARLSSLSRYGQAAVGQAMPALASLLHVRRNETLRDRVERAWLSLGGPAIVEDEHAIEHVYRFLDVIEKHEIAGSLPDVAELESMLDLERVSNDVNARLQVLTMHRAKGLQFDHVLLYGLGRVPGRSDRAVLNWFDTPDEHGDEQKIISPVGPRGELQNDPIHRYIELSDARKDSHEQGRLLYVACTRARKSLHMTGNVRVSPDGDEYRRADPRSLLSLLWEHVSNDYDNAFQEHGGVDRSDDDGDWYQPRLRRFDQAWQLPDVSPPPGADTVEERGHDADAVEFYWVGSAARIAGTVTHRWLQLIAQGRVHIEDAGSRATSERWLTEMGVGDAMLGEICERVGAALSGIRGDPRGQWLLTGEGHAELALSGIYDGKIESVLLDRVRIDDDGTHWIVDYKTSSHEGGGLDAFLQAESDRYRDQLRRYAGLYADFAQEPVRCALYFPLLQAFVEIDVGTVPG